MARNTVKYFEYYTIWTRNLMVRSDLKKSNFLDQLMTSQVPKKDVKYPKIFKKNIKWKEMVSNIINFVWVSLTGREI